MQPQFFITANLKHSLGSFQTASKG